jgi:TPR repeat protein
METSLASSPSSRRRRRPGTPGRRTVTEDSPWIIAGGEASDHPGDLLRAAAQAIPAAEGQLARCEFTGCEYIAQDIPAAVADARSAAQQGSIEAMLAIGAQLQASQIDPDEVQAWQLIDAGLKLQGYEGININVRMIRSASTVLNSPTVKPKARALADQYWQQFGAKILSGLGCTG